MSLDKNLKTIDQTRKMEIRNAEDVDTTATQSFQSRRTQAKSTAWNLTTAQQLIVVAHSDNLVHHYLHHYHSQQRLSTGNKRNMDEEPLFKQCIQHLSTQKGNDCPLDNLSWVASNDSITKNSVEWSNKDSKSVKTNYLSIYHHIENFETICIA